MADKVKTMDAAEVAEIMENDLTRSGRANTKVSTKTVVEDRTEEPARAIVKPVRESTKQLPHGTVLTSYDEPEAE